MSLPPLQPDFIFFSFDSIYAADVCILFDCLILEKPTSFDEFKPISMQ